MTPKPVISRIGTDALNAPKRILDLKHKLISYANCNRCELTPAPYVKAADFIVGDEVVWMRSSSTWSRVRNESVHAVVERVTPKRIRIRLMSNIAHSLTALVRPERLRKP